MTRLILTAIVVIYACTISPAFAKLVIPGTTYYTQKEQCANAINDYLRIRREEATGADLQDKINANEIRVEVMCDGFQVRLVNHDGITMGFIE